MSCAAASVFMVGQWCGQEAKGEQQHGLRRSSEVARNLLSTLVEQQRKEGAEGREKSKRDDAGTTGGRERRRGETAGPEHFSSKRVICDLIAAF